MTGLDFWATRIGQRFFEHTAPKVADQLERINANLEALVGELRLQRESRASKDAAPQPADQR